MKKNITGLGFYLNPRVCVFENNVKINEGIKLFEKEINNIEICYMSDGFFVINLESELEYNDDSESQLNKFNNSSIYSNYANVLYFLFAVIFYKKLDRGLNIYDIVGDESIKVIKEDGIWKKHGITCNNIGRISFNSNCLISRFDDAFEHKVELRDLQKCFDEFACMLDKISEKNLFQTLLLYVNAIQNMKVCRFDTSIILFWTSIEKTIDEVWDKMIGLSDYNNDLKSKIKKSIEYTVSVKINELFLTGILPLELVKKLNNSRKIRNKIIHGQYNLFSIEGEINGAFQEIYFIWDDVRKAATELIIYIYDLNLEIDILPNIQVY